MWFLEEETPLNYVFKLSGLDIRRFFELERRTKARRVARLFFPPLSLQRSTLRIPQCVIYSRLTNLSSFHTSLSLFRASASSSRPPILLLSSSSRETSASHRLSLGISPTVSLNRFVLGAWSCQLIWRRADTGKGKEATRERERRVALCLSFFTSFVPFLMSPRTNKNFLSIPSRFLLLLSLALPLPPN